MERKHLIKDGPVRYFLMTIIFLFIVGIIQNIGSIFVEEAVDTWYVQLRKPEWTPPNQVFGPIWLILYLLIAFVGYIIWTRPHNNQRAISFTFWSLQLFFNGMWTFFFFGLKSPFYGLVDLILVVVLSVIMMIFTFKISKLAFYSFLPYLAWLIYAGYFNYHIYLLNSVPVY